MTARAIDSIWIGERDRKPGDVTDLMASLTEVGLLHPVVITPDGHLVAGGRRLEAAKQLGWTEIDVTVISSLADAELALRAEMDENTCRRDLTPVEQARARRRREKLLKRLAQERKGGRGKKTGGNLPQVSDARKTRAVASQGLGASPRTIDKVEEVLAIAEDEARPEPVRAKAREALTAMDQPAAKVDPHHKAVKELDKYAAAVAEFPELDFYADQPAKAVSLANELRSYVGSQREQRRDILRRNIVAAQRREPAEEAPDYEHLAYLMFLAANQATQVIADKGGAEVFAQAIALADPLLASTWHDEFSSLAHTAAEIAKACRPQIRRVK